MTDDWEYDWDDSGPYSKESVMLEYQQKLDKWKQKLKEYKQEYEDLVVQVTLRNQEKRQRVTD